MPKVEKVDESELADSDPISPLHHSTRKLSHHLSPRTWTPVINQITPLHDLSSCAQVFLICDYFRVLESAHKGRSNMYLTTMTRIVCHQVIMRFLRTVYQDWMLVISNYLKLYIYPMILKYSNQSIFK